MRRILASAALVAATLLPSHALAANTWGTDFSDLWWNPAQSGWGANVVHQGEIVFMTLFVYGEDSKPKWYVASSMASRGGEASHAFDGALYETTGTYLGAGSFDPAAVTTRVVGTATLEFSGIQRGALTYTVDGVSVNVQIERQTFRYNNLAGSYFGAQTGEKMGCGAETGFIENVARYSITHSGGDISITATLGDNLYCTYSGAYSQFGKMGKIAGSFACTNGSTGWFQSEGIEASDKGFMARYYADFGAGCIESGLIGGVKR